jgi:dihydroxyacetone kinase-like predicted kinase
LLVLDSLDDTAVRRWCVDGLAALRRHQREIDELNVYPVPDGDTGTNLVLTLTSAQQALSDAEPPQGGRLIETAHGWTLRVMARGALLGARGNSGVILSQILRGLADAVADLPEVRGKALTRGLATAADAAYQAVASPVEGTVLTVAAAAAEGAAAIDSDELYTVARAAAEAAARALARTPEQLPVLAAAGVVDAGGRGLVVLLEALVAVVTGAPGDVDTGTAPAPIAARRPGTAVREAGSPEYGYEVQFLLDAEPTAVFQMRETLADLGDSLVVVGAGAIVPGGAAKAGAPAGEASSDLQTWHVHVHVNDVGAAIEAGVRAGRPYQISVTHFDSQLSASQADAQFSAAEAGVGVGAEATAGPIDPDARGAVVVAAGAGLASLFAAEGVAVVAGNPSTRHLIAAVRSTGAGRVVVLPNDPNTQAVATAAAMEAHAEGVRVSVVPTRSPVQALAALAVRDPRRRFEDDVIAMAEAAGACRYAEVCYASRESLTTVGRCQAGDVLALVEGEVHLIGTDLAQTCRELLDRLLGGGGEMVTLLTGADAPTDLAGALRDHVADGWPFVEVQIYDGGQPHYPLVVGVE